jgi:hypothetical protein
MREMMGGVMKKKGEEEDAREIAFGRRTGTQQSQSSHHSAVL